MCDSSDSDILRRDSFFRISKNVSIAVVGEFHPYFITKPQQTYFFSKRDWKPNFRKKQNANEPISKTVSIFDSQQIQSEYSKIT